MGDSARRKTEDAAQSIGPSTAPNKALPRRGGVPRSNLIEELIQARLSDFRSVRNLAEMANVTPAAIRKLEAGRGPVATLIAVMRTLPFQVTVLSPASSLAEQLRKRREKLGMSLDVVASKAALPPERIVELESGGGSVESLLRLLSVIAPKVKRRAPERVYWGAERKAERDSRFTPPDFMQVIYRVFGPVNLDPCAHIASPVIAMHRFFLEQGDDGLTDPWSGGLAFVNPPFSGTLDWLRRSYEEWAAGHVKTIVCLVPVRIDSPFFQDVIKPVADIYFLRQRLKFGREGGKPQQTPHSLMLVIFGATARQKALLATLVRGFWAATNHQPLMASLGSATVASRSPVRTSAYIIGSTSCAAPLRRDGRHPVRVCSGPSGRRQGGAR
ncbi:phage N-6-adenine-methyltransferase [Sphingomonas antarctica]|uniref:DNA N-6-adenine-methyltransferase n=1 Tax=Sphingomonas antarctica TaxID=2040274 RepID=UPI0039E8E54D